MFEKWFCTLMLKIMKNISKLEVHRHQAGPQKHWFNNTAFKCSTGNSQILWDFAGAHPHSKSISRQQFSAKRTGEGCLPARVQDHPGALQSSASSACLNWSHLRGCLLVDQADIVGMAFAVRAPSKTCGCCPASVSREMCCSTLAG